MNWRDTGTYGYLISVIDFPNTTVNYPIIYISQIESLPGIIYRLFVKERSNSVVVVKEVKIVRESGKRSINMRQDIFRRRKRVNISSLDLLVYSTRKLTCTKWIYKKFLIVLVSSYLFNIVGNYLRLLM